MAIFASPYCSRYYAVRNNWIVRITSRIVQLRYGTNKNKAWKINNPRVTNNGGYGVTSRLRSDLTTKIFAVSNIRHAATVFYEIARLWAVSVNYIAGTPKFCLIAASVLFQWGVSRVSRPIRTREGGREGGETPNFFAYLRLLVSIKKSKNLHDSARTYQNKLADYKSSRPFRGGKTF